MTRVLVIEDDRRTAAEIAAALGDHGFDVECAYTGRDGLLKATAEKYDAIVLDRMLPGDLDGLGVLATLRTIGTEIPVLILSALSGVDERVRGLRAGGDDYLTKPFEFVELTARLDVLIRRRAMPQRETVLRVGDLQIDLLTREVRRAGRMIDLLPREYRLLEYLMRHAGRVVTRTMLFEEVWGYHYDPQTNVIDVHMGRLRRKLEEGELPQMIHTVRGSGYVLRAAIRWPVWGVFADFVRVHVLADRQLPAGRCRRLAQERNGIAKCHSLQRTLAAAGGASNTRSGGPPPDRALRRRRPLGRRRCRDPADSLAADGPAVRLLVVAGQ
jgi:two-component system OmpR family response regulator